MNILALIPTFQGPAPVCTPGADVERAVSHYARRIGCTPSNITAAVAWAQRAPGGTLVAIRAGKRRAISLLARQKWSTPA